MSLSQAHSPRSRSPLSDITSQVNNRANRSGSPSGFSDGDGLQEPSGQFQAMHDFFAPDLLIIPVRTMS